MAHLPQFTQDQLWQEIVKVLSIHTELPVLKIINNSNYKHCGRDQKPTIKRAMNKILYQKARSKQVMQISGTPPMWRLPDHHNSHNINDNNQRNNRYPQYNQNKYHNTNMNSIYNMNNINNMQSVNNMKNVNNININNMNNAHKAASKKKNNPLDDFKYDARNNYRYNNNIIMQQQYRNHINNNYHSKSISNKTDIVNQNKSRNTEFHNNYRVRGNARRRGRGRGRATFIKPITLNNGNYSSSNMKQRDNEIEEEQQSMSQINPDEEESKDDMKLEHNSKATHISSFISIPFEENNENILCYIYYIKFKDDPYDTPIAIILPKQIDNDYLKDIRFCIETKKNEEKEWKELISKWMEQKSKMKKSKYVKFDKKYVHQTEISLHSVKSKYNETKHELKKEDFNKIKKCNEFIFQKLDNKYKKLNIFNDESEQKRFYYICPLQATFCGSDDFVIDYQCINRIYLGSGGMTNGERLNAKQFRKELSTPCNLKYEIIEVVESNKIGISYGVHKQKFDNIRQHRNNEKKEDDLESIASIQSFADQQLIDNTNKLRKINKNTLLKKMSKYDILLVRTDNNIHIENALIVTENEKIAGYELQCCLFYETLTNSYPTGITCNLWYKLKTMPSILYRIETFLNTIDFAEKLSNIDPMSQNGDKKVDDDDSNKMNLTFIFEAMHRSSSTTKMNYQIINRLGLSILEFMSTLNSFEINPKCNAKQIYNDILKATHKKETSHHSSDFLLQIANKLNIRSYAILYDFDYTQWSPPQFQDRKHNSLYDLNTKPNLVDFRNGEYLESYLLQSVIGAFFISAMHESYINDNNVFSNAINKTLRFLENLGIITHVNDGLILKENSIISVEDNDNIDGLKEIAIGDALEMNVLLQKSLETVIDRKDKNEPYKEDGISFKTLKALGSSILHLLINWYICCNLIDHFHHNGVGQKYIFKKGKKKEYDKANFSEDMNEYMEYFVNMSYQFVNHHFDQYMTFDQDTLQEIEKYKKKIDFKNKKQILIQVDDVNENEKSEMETQISPIGPKKRTRAPPILSDCYQALFGTIFVGSHSKTFQHQAPYKWNLKPCIDFLTTFGGKICVDGWKGFDWNKWIE